MKVTELELFCLFCLFRTVLAHDLIFYDVWCNHSFILYICIWKILIRKRTIDFTYLFLHPRNVRKWRQHQKNQKKKTDEEQKTDTDIVDSAGMDSPKQTADDIDILDNTECKFNVNSFKIVYVVNSEYYLYKRTALTKAKEVRVYKSFICVNVEQDIH